MVYNRSHLFNKVDVAVPPKVTLIIADSGFGKTILAKQYVETLKRPSIWSPLNQWSAYAHTLHQETENLLSQIYPSMISLADQQEETSYDATRLAKMLKAFGAPIVYVIDNCHYINQHPDGLQWLENFIHASDHFCHVVLVGQEQPKINLLDVIASGDCLILGKNQLRLTSEDVIALAKHYNIDRSTLQTQIDIHQGWFAAIKPLLEQPSTDTVSALTFQEYVASLMDQLSDETLHTLYISTIPETFVVKQLETIFPQANIQHHLHQITETSLAPIKLPDSDDYQYHDLIRNQVRIHLQKQDNKRYRHINDQFGGWYEKEGQFDRAIYHYLEAEHPDAARQIMEYIFHVYERHGYTDALLALEQQFRKYDICIPLLQLGAATIKITKLQFEEALESINYIEQSEQASLDLPVEANIKNRKAYIALRQGRIQDAIHMLEQIRSDYHLDSIDLIPLAASTTKLLGQAYLEDSRYRQAESALREAQQLYKQVNSQLETAAILQDLALVYSKTGRLVQAGETLQQMLSIRMQLNQPSGLAHAHNNIGSYYIQCHDYVNGEHHFLEGLEASQTANDERITAFLHWNLGDLHRDTGKPTAALSHYEQALTIVNTSDSFVACGVLASLARLWIYQQRYAAAIQNFVTLKATAQRIHSKLYEVIANMSLLVLEPYQKHHVPVIEDLLDRLKAFGNPIEVIRVIGLLLEYAIQNNEQVLTTKLTQLLHSYTVSHYSTQPFVAAALHSRVLFQYVMKHQALFPEILHQVRALKTQQTKHQQQLQEQVGLSMITVFLTTFNTESINLNDVQLSYQQLPGHQERDFLYWIYFTGPKPRARVMLRYWSDSTPNRGQSALTSMLYRIRQKLGPIVVTENEIYQINPHYNVTSDATSFEKLHQQAKVGRINDVRTEDLWLQALSFYRGEFLPDFDSDWIPPLREKYHQYYIDTLISLSQCALIREDDTAIAYARWAVREDPYNEFAYQHLMKVFSSFYRVDDILETYTTLSKHLHAELGVEVSVETQKLFDALTQRR